MAERSKAVDLSSTGGSTARVRIPVRSKYFFFPVENSDQY